MSQSSEPRAWVITGAQRARARPFAIASAASIIAGGLIAAMAGPFGWQHGSWAAAYLVLVGGVAQSVLIVGMLALTPERPTRSGRERSAVWPYCALWNVATILVIGGTLMGSFALVLLGSLGLIAVLITCWPLHVPKSAGLGGWRLSYRLFLGFMGLSTLVGCALALR